MTLVDGDELLRIIGAGIAGAPLVLPAAPTTGPTCPACGGDMVRRTARRGPSAGSEFFGCARFPECRATVPVPEEALPVR